MTLCLYQYLKPVFLQTMANTSYASVIYYFLHVASSRINEAKYFIISHIACWYTCIKNTVALVLTALLFMPRLSEHERPGAIGLLKAGVSVSGVARYYNCHPLAVWHLRESNQATRIVKGRHRPGQLRMATDIKTTTNVDYIDDIYIDDIRFGWLPTLPDE